MPVLGGREDEVKKKKKKKGGKMGFDLLFKGNNGFTEKPHDL